MRLLVTGGCGFIGNNFIRYILEHYQPEMITSVDALTYPSSMESSAAFSSEFGERYEFFKADIADAERVDEVLTNHSYFALVNFAAETHSHSSASPAPEKLIRTNIVGVATLLEAARRRGVKRFVQVSTDEVYGSLAAPERFTEQSALNPSSIYATTKAAADLLVLEAHKSYGQDVVVTRCSNNYGPYQNPRKLIPTMILCALSGQPLPVYGDGLDVRDWIHVDDHCAAVFDVLMQGRAGEIYNVGGDTERKNLDVIRSILRHLGKDENLIKFVPDPHGHERRYAIDSSKLRNEVGWKPLYGFERGLLQTIDWYRRNEWWCNGARRS
jgi:dTDP-glucose 4,6-dehydratase